MLTRLFYSEEITSYRRYACVIMISGEKPSEEYKWWENIIKMGCVCSRVCLGSPGNEWLCCFMYPPNDWLPGEKNAVIARKTWSFSFSGRRLDLVASADDCVRYFCEYKILWWSIETYEPMVTVYTTYLRGTYDSDNKHRLFPLKSVFRMMKCFLWSTDWTFKFFNMNFDLI